jgi:hypothetical protein
MRLEIFKVEGRARRIYHRGAEEEHRGCGEKMDEESAKRKLRGRWRRLKVAR